LPWALGKQPDSEIVINNSLVEDNVYLTLLPPYFFYFGMHFRSGVLFLLLQNELPQILYTIQRTIPNSLIPLCTHIASGDILKQIVKISFVLVCLSMLICGCVGEKEGSTNPEANIPSYVKSFGSIQGNVTWLESNWNSSDSEPYIVESNIDVSIPVNRLAKISITINCQDSDQQHAESDEGSSPDEVTASIHIGNQSIEDGPKPTPTTLYLETNIDTSSEEFLPSNFSIKVHAECNGGKPYHIIFPDPFPSLMVYKDQGILVHCSIEYEYMKEE